MDRHALAGPQTPPTLAHILVGYVAALLMVTLATLAGLLVAAKWGSSAVVLLYLLPVLAAAIYAGLGPGLVAAVVKSLVRRLRPDPQAFDAFAFRPWGERGFDGGGLSFPSEHAAIALTGALMLCRLYPRGWFVYLLWAGSCSAGRVMMQDHFISDIAGSLLLAVLMQAAAWRIWRARLMPQGSDQLPITPA